MDMFRAKKEMGRIEQAVSAISDEHGKYDDEISREKKLVSAHCASLKSKLGANADKFLAEQFSNLSSTLQGLKKALAASYKDSSATCQKTCKTQSEALKKLSEEIAQINQTIDSLNKVNFNELVPPMKFEPKDPGQVTVQTLKNGEWVPAELSDVKFDEILFQKEVDEISQLCTNALMHIEEAKTLFKKELDEQEWQDYLSTKERVWMEEKKQKCASALQAKINEMFSNGKKFPSSEFLAEIDAEREKFASDVLSGSDQFSEEIYIGDISTKLKCPNKLLWVLKSYPNLFDKMRDDFTFNFPCTVEKSAGNLLINCSDNGYERASISDFIHQYVLRFVLSFPVNRVSLCLVDIDDKADLSALKSLTKVDNNILMNGIIRDDRELENTIKNMEQIMYKINDDFLSYNNVENIFEYNKKFEANPQSVHLLVLVNFPSGATPAIMKRLAKIIANGNKAGVFTLLINNTSISKDAGKEYNDVLKAARENGVELSVEEGKLVLGTDKSMILQPRFDLLNRKNLPNIIEMLKEKSEGVKQKVIALSSMFDETDRLMSKVGKVLPAEEVLDIPIGMRGGEVQNILLKTTGAGSAHAVVIGGTGSGKSNLLHTIIMNACYKYSPEDLNLYLVDFKGGVEFKYYEANKNVKKQLPHIKLTGLTSELEDGVAILENLYVQLRERETEFRRNGVEDIVQYKKLGKKMPRIFVIIDEIQELFEQDDELGQKAINIMRELFQKGRAFGINILWASQSIPKVAGLKDKVLNQIGNRISLRLNEPDDAADIKIDPKVVKNLNRPEKGLGVINDIRYGNDSIEFRVAYAENSENRKKYTDMILGKWKDMASNKQPLFIVGDDGNANPMEEGTLYSHSPQKKEIVSKSLDDYRLDLGQNYITGKPFAINLSLRETKQNVLVVGPDIEMARDMMGYSLLSILLEQSTNLDCLQNSIKIFYANGEIISSKNVGDLYNQLPKEFSVQIEDVSASDNFVGAIKEVYQEYLHRSKDINKQYNPIFVVVHSLQRYSNLFEDSVPLDSMQQGEDMALGLKFATDFFDKQSTSKNKDTIFSQAVFTLLSRGSELGIHFVISCDNPLKIIGLKHEMDAFGYKIFLKGVDQNMVYDILGEFKAIKHINNPNVALVSTKDYRAKIKPYRYNKETDENWFKDLKNKYSNID